VNRSKRSCTLDLGVPEGREIARRLAASADVVIENFRSGGAERLGLGFEQLRALNPRLVYCSITGFGSEREPPDRPGYDFVVQAESGLMAITGEPDGEPTKVGVAVVDVLAGTTAAVGILAALRQRDETGVGDRLEVPLLDVAHDEYARPQTRDEARALMRALIGQRLHGQVLHTRTVLMELNDL
jgi:crotonobetainyl-CoA:carnitine CoA-transferase CaiB-like acyl-CoA transferase